MPEKHKRVCSFAASKIVSVGISVGGTLRTHNRGCRMSAPVHHTRNAGPYLRIFRVLSNRAPAVTVDVALFSIRSCLRRVYPTQNSADNCNAQDRRDDKQRCSHRALIEARRQEKQATSNE